MNAEIDLAIDSIVSIVEICANGIHNTQNWTEEWDRDSRTTFWERIDQEAATAKQIAQKVIKAARCEAMEKFLEVVCGQTTVNMGEVQLLTRIETDVRALIEEE